MRRKLLALTFILFSFSLFSQSEAFDLSKLSPYSHYHISTQKSLGERNKKSKKITSLRKFAFDDEKYVEYIDAYIELNGELNFELLKKWGVKVNSVFEDIITAQVPIHQLENLAAIKEISRIEVAHPATKRMDQARHLSSVDKIQREVINETKYTGKGVVIGVIDNEFDYRHINFREKNGKNLRIKRVWDQNGVGVSPKNYSYGTEYKSEEDILAIPYGLSEEDVAEGTHGTHVLGIAAGSDKSNANIYYGVAPEAELVLVCYKKNQANDFDDRENSDKVNNVSVSDAIKYIYDYADAVGKPCVINMSLGSHFGPHDGSSSFDRIADKMQGEGRLLVGAVGNEREKGLHVSHLFKNNTDTLRTLLEFANTQKNETFVDIWGEEDEKFGLQFTIYDEAKKEKRDVFPAVNLDSTSPITYDLSEVGLEGTINIYRSEKNAINNRYNLFVCISIPERPHKKFLGLKIFDAKGVVHAWLADEKAKFVDKNLEGWRAVDEGSTMGEIGGTGKRIISVGAYLSKKRYKTLNGVWDLIEGKMNDIAPFSSIGRTLDGRIKPDIAAPGASIISSYSGNEAFFSQEGVLRVKKTSLEGRDYYYGSMEGSSMAAPHVTGILALWLEAKNDLSPEDLAVILEKTAIKDEYTGSDVNAEWGFGKIDAYKGLLECLESEGEKPFDFNRQISINYINRAAKQMSISCSSSSAVEQLNLKIWSIEGTLFLEQKLQFNATTTVDLSKLPNGVFIVKIQGEGLKELTEKIIL